MPLVGPGPDGVDGALGVVGVEDGAEGRPLHDAASAAKHTVAIHVCRRGMLRLRSKLHGFESQL